MIQLESFVIELNVLRKLLLNIISNFKITYER